ncbi:MAG: hypothetical protein ACRDEA_17890 [Microcystaceae cyanobacterium]
MKTNQTIETNEPITGEALFADLLNRPVTLSPVNQSPEPTDFTSLLNGEFKPAVAPVIPAPIEMEEIEVMVWIEKVIQLDRSVCGICGLSSCGCTPRKLVRMTKTIRYQQKQRQSRPKQ